MQADWEKLMLKLQQVRFDMGQHHLHRSALYGSEHRHENQFHISYLVSGRSRIRVEGELYDVGPADAMFIRPRQLHTSIGDAASDFELIQFKFSVPARIDEEAIPHLPVVTHIYSKATFVPALERLAEDIKKGSLCGLGQTAPNPVLSTLRHFREEYEEHIVLKTCRAAVCEGLVRAPCQHACPAGINVPEYLALAAATTGDAHWQSEYEKARDAYDRLPLRQLETEFAEEALSKKCVYILMQAAYLFRMLFDFEEDPAAKDSYQRVLNSMGRYSVKIPDQFTTTPAGVGFGPMPDLARCTASAHAS